MNRSETIGKLGEALAKAQRVFKPAVKSAENPFFKSKYADLQAVWEVCREGLAANGLSVIQGTILEDMSGLLYLETLLAHTSGEWISSVYPIKPVKEDPQGIGSAVTYARRYALSAMAGIVTVGEDDDANVASGHESPKVENHKPTPTPVVEKPLLSTGASTTSVNDPEPLSAADRKALEHTLTETAKQYGYIAGSYEDGRPKVDYDRLGKFLKESGLSGGYIKKFSDAEVQYAIDLLIETGAKKIRDKIDEAEANGDLGAAANRLFNRFQ